MTSKRPLHFGIVCPPIPGHLNPLYALGRELIRRGHRVTLFQIPDLEAKARSEGLEFAPLLGERFGPGDLARRVAELSALSGKASITFAIDRACEMAELILDALPEAARQAAIDMLIVDQNEPAGGSVAEHLQIPFVSTCTSLPLNRESSVPPPVLGWDAGDGILVRLKNRVGYAIWDRFIRRINETLNLRRKQWNLPRLRIPDDAFSRLGQFAQMPREFDFPRRELPREFSYTGPWIDDRSCVAPFPFEKLDGRRLVYASLGTIQPKNSSYFQVIAESCAGLDIQLVVTRGGSDSASLEGLAGNPLVVDFAPQLELLGRAALTITHAGMNTTQQSLLFGVPLIAIPLTHDQPAIAARISRTGAGIVIEPGELTVKTLRSAVERVLAVGSSYRLRATEMQKAYKKAGGIAAVADALERIPLRGTGDQ